MLSDIDSLYFINKICNNYYGEPRLKGSLLNLNLRVAFIRYSNELAPGCPGSSGRANIVALESRYV